MEKKREKGFTLVEIMIVVAIIAILSAIAVPNFMTARLKSRTNSCKSNLKLLDSTIAQYAMDNKLGQGETCMMSTIIPTYIKSIPECQSGGTYGDSDGSTWTPNLFHIDGTPWCSIGSSSAAGGYPHILTQ